MSAVLLYIFILCEKHGNKFFLENGTNAAKFGDPAKTIYADSSLRMKNSNGGAPQFILSDLNNLNGAFSSSSMGNGTLGNGHVSTGFSSQQPPPLPPTRPPHVTTNPLSAYDEQQEPFPDDAQVSSVIIINVLVHVHVVASHIKIE